MNWFDWVVIGFSGGCVFSWIVWYGFKNSNTDPTGFWDSRSKGKGK